MEIEFTVPFRRQLAAGTLSVELVPEPLGRPPRIARLLALAHKLDALVRSGEVASYGAEPPVRRDRLAPARSRQTRQRARERLECAFRTATVRERIVALAKPATSFTPIQGFI
jgi:hypothetical protein